MNVSNQPWCCILSASPFPMKQMWSFFPISNGSPTALLEIKATNTKIGQQKNTFINFQDKTKVRIPSVAANLKANPIGFRNRRISHHHPRDVVGVLTV